MSFLDQNKSTPIKEQPIRVYFIDFELQFDNFFLSHFQVEATLKLRPPLPPNVDARILVSSCSFATFVTLETFDLIWKQAENFKNVSDYFLSIVHKLVRFNFLSKS